MQQCGVKLCTDGIAATFMADLEGGTGATVFTKTPIAGSEGHDNGGKWLRYDLGSKELTTGPHMIREHPWFKRLPTPFDVNVDAAVTKPDKPNEVYLFSEDMWLLWDKQIDRAARGPFRMREHELFEKLPEPFSMNITAAFNMKSGTNEVMLFSQQEEGTGTLKTMVSMYLTWNAAENTVVDGPFKVDDASKPLNLPEAFHSRIDAALNRRAESSSVILFSGASWVEFDYSKNAVTHGPYLISQHPLFQPISDALELCSGYDLNRLGNLTTKLELLRPVPRSTVHWIAGTGGGGFAESNGKPAVPVPNSRAVPDDEEEGKGGEKVMFNTPRSMAVVGGDTAYIADSKNNAIRRVDLASGNTTTVAGGGAVFAGFMDGLGTAARFNRPVGITAMRLDAIGDVVYVADADNHAIRRLAVPKVAPYDATTETVTGISPKRIMFPCLMLALLLAGGGTGRCNNCTVYPSTSRCSACCQCQNHGFQDGSGHDGKLYEPSGVTLVYNATATGATKNEFIYVADKLNHAIRRVVVNPGGNIGDMVTIAGGTIADNDTVEANYIDEIVTGAPGFSDGVGADAQFNQPSSISALRAGTEDVLYVADTGSNAVRRVTVTAGLAAAEEQEENEAEEEEDGSPLDNSEEGAANRKLLFRDRKWQEHASLHSGTEHPKQLAHRVSIGEDPAEDPEAPAEADTATEQEQPAAEQPAGEETAAAAPAIRFTAPGGTAAVDQQCAFPFIFDDQGYNDCATVESEELGITADKFNPQNGWCRTTFEEDDKEGEPMEWGPCMPANYMPDTCVVSGWSSWSRCGKICGTSNTTRTRKVIHEGESQTECPHLEEMQECNVHPCAETITVAGGYTTAGSKLGVGFTDIYGSPDLKFGPATISALRAEDDTDVVFVSGNPSQSARIRRIDVSRGVHNNCSSAQLHSDPDASVQECRTFETLSGSLEARVASVIGTPSVYSTTSIAAATEEELYIAARNSLSKVDLSLQVPCASWLGSDMNSWIFKDDKTTSEQSNPVQMDLLPEYGRQGKWEFSAHRQRELFSYAGEDYGYVTKNTLCMKQLPPGVPKEEAHSACCTFKQAPEIDEPKCDDEKGDDTVCTAMKTEFASMSKSLLEQVKVL
jgi:hypothetical protein